jgi:hypothetical protein
VSGNRVVAADDMECMVKKKQIGDHTLLQRGFGLGTPEGTKGGWATPGNTGRGRHRERAHATSAPDQQQTCVHQHERPHQQQTPQPKGYSRQEPSTQQQEQSADKRTRSRKDPKATACQNGGHPQVHGILLPAPITKTDQAVGLFFSLIVTRTATITAGLLSECR